MKKCFSLLLFSLFIIHPLAILADSWRIFERDFTYVNGGFSMSNRLPKDRSLSHSFRIADGMTMVVGSIGLPIMLDREGNFLDENTTGFEDLQYAPSSMLSVVYDKNGISYFRSTSVVAYYDTSAKKWLGVNVRSGKTTGNIPSIKLDNVFGMVFDKDNNLLLTGTSGDKPVYAVLKGSEWFIHPIAATSFPANENMRKGDYKASALNINIADKSFRDMYILTSPVLSGDGNIWFALGCNKSQGVMKLDETGTFTYVDSAPLTGFITDYKGNVIFASSDGIGVIKAGTSTLSVLLKEAGTTIYADKEALWYAFSPILKQPVGITEEEYTYLKRYDFETGKTKAYTTKNTTFSNQIIHASGDSNGNASFVSGSSLYLLDKSNTVKYEEKWTYYSPGYMDDLDFLKKNVTGLNKNGKHPTSVSRDAWNNRWVGVYESGQWKYYKMAVDEEAGLGLGLKGTHPQSVCYTSKGILIGTQNDGVMLFDPAAEKAGYIAGYDLKKMGKDVRSIKEDKKGNIWIGTNKGLILYDGTTFSLFDKKKSEFKSDRVNCLHITPADILWVGTGGEGVFSFDGTTWTAYTKKEGLRGQNIASLSSAGETIYTSDRNSFRISDKLFIIEGGVVKEEKLPFYIASNAIDSDDKGNIWLIGHKRGVICRAKDGSSKTYDQGNSPLGYTGDGTAVYSMNGYALDGKLYITSYYHPLSNVKDKNYKRPEGASPFTKAPIEELAEKIGKKVNTFDETMISVMDID